MQQTSKKTDGTKQEISLVRVEANLEDLPVFSATKGTRTEEIVRWQRDGRDPVTHRPVQQRLILRPAVGLGLPGELERDVYYLVIAPWLEQHGFGPEGLVGPIRYQDACVMAWLATVRPHIPASAGCPQDPCFLPA